MRSLASSTAESDQRPGSPAESRLGLDPGRRRPGPVRDGRGVDPGRGAKLGRPLGSDPSAPRRGHRGVRRGSSRVPSSAGRSCRQLLPPRASWLLGLAALERPRPEPAQPHRLATRMHRAAFFALAAAGMLMVRSSVRPGQADTARARAARRRSARAPCRSRCTPTRSIAVVAALALVAVVVWNPASARVAIALSLAVFLVALSATVALGWGYKKKLSRSHRASCGASRRLSERRLELWHDAVVADASSPADRCRARAVPARKPGRQERPRRSWAHHAFLQQGAEQGIPGMVLLVLLFVWGFVRLGG